MVTIPDSVKRRVRELMDEAFFYEVDKMCGKHPLTAVLWIPKGEHYFTGWNGPPTRALHAYPDCSERSTCPRRHQDSGEGMDICPTSHAEVKTIGQAAESGVPTKRGVMLIDSWFPCRPCATVIEASGLIALVTPDEIYENREKHILVEGLRNQPYHFEMAEGILFHSGIEIIVDPDIRPKYQEFRL